MFIITVLSGIITIILGWRKFYKDILSKNIILPVYVYLIVFFFVALAIIFWPAIESRPKPLRTIEGESFGIQRVYADGKRFVNCRFDGTEIVIRGEVGGAFESCQLTNIKFTIDGPAAAVILTLEHMYTIPGFRPFIDNMFEAIKAGKIPRATSPSHAADK